MISEVRFDLRGCLEAAMASEATYMAVIGNMHMDTRVIKVADFKPEIKFDFRGCLEAAVVSEATWMSVIGNMHMDTRVAKAAEFKSKVKMVL